MKAQLMKVVPKNFTRTVGRKALQAKKHSPHIFFGAGLAGIVTSGFMACRATLRLSSTLDDIQQDIDTVRELKHQYEPKGQYAIEETGRDTTYVYIKAGVTVIKLYGPSVMVAAVSIGMLSTSHAQLARRNTALMAAYAAIQAAYEEYRVRVRDVVGEEKELDLYRGIRTEIGKDGNDKEIEIYRVNPKSGSPYSVEFDSRSCHWDKNPELNRLFIQCVENFANKLLNVRGHVFLNEIYDRLDVERTVAGSVVGWVRDGEGDGYIDFGMYEAINSDFLTGLMRVAILDFNVDGVIYDKI
jgi:hypothetical protein